LGRGSREGEATCEHVRGDSKEKSRSKKARHKEEKKRERETTNRRGWVVCCVCCVVECWLCCERLRLRVLGLLGWLTGLSFII
jgi:hypothetical protein